MTKLSTTLAASALLALAGSPAFAGGSVTKTWVSSTTGNDTGTCQFTTPCKTFAYAITQTLAGGEIDVKDGGSYGPVTITQAVSIVSEGVLAAISVPSGGTGITVAAGSQEKVVLDGLTIDGHGVGTNGVVFNSAYSLTIQNCHVRNITQFGIALQANDATFFHVVNTEVASAGSVAIILQPATSPLNGVLSGVFAHDSTNGIEGAGLTNTSVMNSVVSGNNYGIRSISPANILVGTTTISNNKTYGIYNQSGAIQSYGDNYINANGADISGTLLSIAKR